MKQTGIALLVVFLLSYSPVSALETNTTTTDPVYEDELRELKPIEKPTSKLLRPTIIKERLEKREEIKTNIETRRKELKEMIEEKREEIKEEMDKKREELKNKLELVKDEKKKMAAENLDTRLAAINKNQTDRMSESIEKLSTFLTKIIELADKAEAAGQDTTVLDTAIQNAQTALASAEAAITTQAGKEYVATVTTEARLKSSFSTVVKQLQTDLKSTQEKVKAARDSIKLAAQELEKLRESREVPTASESAQ